MIFDKIFFKVLKIKWVLIKVMEAVGAVGIMGAVGAVGMVGGVGGVGAVGIMGVVGRFVGTLGEDWKNSIIFFEFF